MPRLLRTAALRMDEVSGGVAERMIMIGHSVSKEQRLKVLAGF